MSFEVYLKAPNLSSGHPLLILTYRLMNNYKITVLFVIQRNKMNKKGLCPIRCRMTYQKKRKVFSSGLFINPEHWSSSQQEAKPPSKENNIINTQLSLIRDQMGFLGTG